MAVMKVAAIFALLAVSAFATSEREYRTAFLQFVRENGKSYSQAEFTAKYATFKANMDFVAQWNAQEGEHHEVAINQFADLTAAEFARLYNGLRVSVDASKVNYVASPTATAVDWRTKGAVTPVKNQGQCGSCWSFSTTGSTEGAHQIKTGSLVSLSEQNLVDCSTAQGNQGCNGGLMTQAMDYIISNKGIDTEASYPYTAQDGTCRFKTASVGATLASYTNVQQGSESDLVAKITLGPTSVAIDASHSSFQLYSKGVYYEPACSSTALDHGVLAVGYDTDGSKPYYIVKNSWGTSWGQAGYIWMSRNRNNNCGIATMATLPHA
jgi:cathepsin L